MNSLPNDKKRNIRPTHPGEMLREDFMPDYGLTATSLAHALGISPKSVTDLLNERCALNSATALCLARFFGNSPKFWLNAQQAVDLWQTEQEYQEKLAHIQPINRWYLTQSSSTNFSTNFSRSNAPASLGFSDAGAS